MNRFVCDSCGADIVKGNRVNLVRAGEITVETKEMDGLSGLRAENWDAFDLCQECYEAIRAKMDSARREVQRLAGLPVSA